MYINEIKRYFPNFIDKTKLKNYRTKKNFIKYEIFTVYLVAFIFLYTK